VFAAHYVGVSVSKFDSLVQSGRMPAPVRIDGRVVWGRVALDAYFEDLAAADPPNPWDELLQKPQQPE
jgi:predicted DNA-binding transcriptional regulator AlpA